jgi:hypothetical protein
MKRHGQWILAALIVASQMWLVQVCKASAPDCDSSPRIVGAFGAENHPGSPVPLAADIRALLPGVRAVRRVLDTNLAPSGEKVVVYDTAADDSDPHPKVAFVANGHLVKVFDGPGLAARGGGFERYLASCQIDLATGQKALAVALSTAFDGTGSAFAVIQWQSGEYRVILNPIAIQGRMEFGVLNIELWSRSPKDAGGNAQNPDPSDFDCDWCPHQYVVTEFAWRNGKYVKTSSKRTARTYDPAELSGAPLSGAK